MSTKSNVVCLEQGSTLTSTMFLGVLDKKTREAIFLYDRYTSEVMKEKGLYYEELDCSVFKPKRSSHFKGAKFGYSALINLEIGLQLPVLTYIEVVGVKNVRNTRPVISVLNTYFELDLEKEVGISTVKNIIVPFSDLFNLRDEQTFNGTTSEKVFTCISCGALVLFFEKNKDGEVIRYFCCFNHDGNEVSFNKDLEVDLLPMYAYKERKDKDEISNAEEDASDYTLIPLMAAFGGSAESDIDKIRGIDFTNYELECKDGTKYNVFAARIFKNTPDFTSFFTLYVGKENSVIFDWETGRFEGVDSLEDLRKFVEVFTYIPIFNNKFNKYSIVTDILIIPKNQDNINLGMLIHYRDGSSPAYLEFFYLQDNYLAAKNANDFYESILTRNTGGTGLTTVGEENYGYSVSEIMFLNTLQFPVDNLEKLDVDYTEGE